jgi:hypothetical protein
VLTSLMESTRAVPCNLKQNLDKVSTFNRQLSLCEVAPTTTRARPRLAKECKKLYKVVRLVTALNKFISVHFLHRYAELFRFIFVSNQPNFASSCQDSFGVSTVVTYSCSVHECTTLDIWQSALHPFAVGLAMFALQIGARNVIWISCNARRTPMLPAYLFT